MFLHRHVKETHYKKAPSARIFSKGCRIRSTSDSSASVSHFLGMARHPKVWCSKPGHKKIQKVKVIMGMQWLSKIHLLFFSRVRKQYIHGSRFQHLFFWEIVFSKKSSQPNTEAKHTISRGLSGLTIYYIHRMPLVCCSFCVVHILPFNQKPWWEFVSVDDDSWSLADYRDLSVWENDDGGNVHTFPRRSKCIIFKYSRIVCLQMKKALALREVSVLRACITGDFHRRSFLCWLASTSYASSISRVSHPQTVTGDTKIVKVSFGKLNAPSYIENQKFTFNDKAVDLLFFWRVIGAFYQSEILQTRYTRCDIVLSNSMCAHVFFKFIFGSFVSGPLTVQTQKWYQIQNGVVFNSRIHQPAAWTLDK